MKNTKTMLLAFIACLALSCKNDDESPTTGLVNIRVENTGSITLQSVIIDSNTFLDIAPGGFSAYQEFTSDIGLPPSFFTVKTSIGERGIVYDYAQGATIEQGFHTFRISMNEDAEISIEFPPD